MNVPHSSYSDRISIAQSCRALFNEGATGDFSLLAPGVYRGWLRSKKAGIDPAISALSNSRNSKSTLNAFNEFLSYPQHRSVLYSERLSRFNELLKSCNAAMFYLDGSLRIVEAAGNEDLLQALSARGIQLGCCFQEKWAGSNSTSLSYECSNSTFANGKQLNIPTTNDRPFSHKEQVLLLGPEHYCEVLSPYASFSDRIRFPSAHLNNQELYIQLIVPLMDFWDGFVSLCRYFLEEVRASVSLNHQPHIKLQLSLLKANATANKTMSIIVDKNDVVVDVDEHLCELYGNTKEELCGQNAYAMMPEHSHLFGRVKKGEIIKNFNYLCKAVPVGMADKEFYMTLVPLFEETRDLKEYLGFACTIMHAQNMRDSMNKLVNLGAHFTFDDLLGNNEDFLLVKELAIQAAESISNVLLFGENGTGKEVFAQAIHNGSDRCDKPFITINCSALPKESIGRVLFGSVDDMTGEGMSGKYEQANEGTLFIDEISEMPLEMQAILLKALEEKRVTRLGDTESRKVNVRIIAATDSDLTACIKSGRFRLDLYYRINVVSLIIPPLRKRAEDIPLLAEFFLSQFKVSLNRNITRIAESALDRMRTYSWPGNIRELQNVIERCVNTCKSRELTENLLPSEIGQQKLIAENYSAEQETEDLKKPSSAFGSYKAAESEKIKSLMKKHKGNKTSVAAELGVTRATLYRKLKNISDWEL